MRYKRFEDLPVWNTAIELAIGVYQLTSKPEFDKRFSLKDQLERAAVSVSNNIAEASSAALTTSCSPSFTSPVALQAKAAPSFACSIVFIGLLNYAQTLTCYEQRRKVARANLRPGWARCRILTGRVNASLMLKCAETIERPANAKSF